MAKTKKAAATKATTKATSRKKAAKPAKAKHEADGREDQAQGGESLAKYIAAMPENGPGIAKAKSWIDLAELSPAHVADDDLKPTRRALRDDLENAFIGLHVSAENANLSELAKVECVIAGGALEAGIDVLSLAPARLDAMAAGVKSRQPGHGDVAGSIDFRSVRWFGEIYSFTANQAPVVKLLYEHWLAGTPDVGDDTLLSAVDPESPPARVRVLFRDHPAWEVMIVAGGTRGTHRLADSPQENSTRA